LIFKQHDHANHKEPQVAFELPPLPYAYDALEPYIDEETMRLHHDKHHQTYVTNANNALEGTEWADRPVEEVLQNLDQISDEMRNAVRNNPGGAAVGRARSRRLRAHRRAHRSRSLGVTGERASPASGG
jgi:superoxide dismutase